MQRDDAGPPENDTQGPFSDYLRLAISRRGLPLDRLLARLRANGVELSLSTLSKWQTGASKPSGHQSFRALALLERELGLGTGDLARRVGARSRRGRPVVPGPCATMCDTLGIDPGLTALRCSISSVHVHAELNAEGRLLCFRERLILTSRSDGLDSFVRTAGYLELHAPSVQTFSTTDAVVQPDVGTGSVSGWRIALPRPLLRGQASLVEWGLFIAYGPTVTSLAVCTNVHHRQVVFEVTWPADRPLTVVATASRLDAVAGTVRRRVHQGGRLVEAFTHPYPGKVTLDIEQAGQPFDQEVLDEHRSVTRGHSDDTLD